MIDPGLFETEVRELHAFFERWYSGTAQRTEFSRLDVLADSFEMIGPDGRLRDVRQVRAYVAAGYGCRPTTFDIRNVSVNPDAPIGTYEEWQTASGTTTARFSSAVMMPASGMPNGLRWMHVHETWLPDPRS